MSLDIQHVLKYMNLLKVVRRKLDPGASQALAFLLESQYWSRPRLAEYQWQRVQALLGHAYDNVPHYRLLFDRHGTTPKSIQSPEDLRKLPILCKSDIQNSFHDLISKRADPKEIWLESTGGSTGVPVNFYHDATYKQWADAARVRAWRDFVGLSADCTEAVLWGAVRDIGRRITTGTVVYRLLREGELQLNTFDLDDRALRRFLCYYNLVSPALVRGYASSLAHVAAFIETRGLPIRNPLAVISSTEVLRSSTRQDVARVFKAPVFDSYGCREVSQIATECSAHCGLHICAENQYVELEGSNIIVTNLNNYSMPLIRYRIGDMADSIESSSCACGRSAPRIMKLLGRDNDNIELPGGKVVNGEFFEFLFFGLSSVIQYQVTYRRSAGTMTVRLHVRDNDVNIGDMVRRKMIDNFDFHKVDIIYTDHFDKTPTGKLRFVYSVP